MLDYWRLDTSSPSYQYSPIYQQGLGGGKSATFRSFTGFNTTVMLKQLVTSMFDDDYITPEEAKQNFKINIDQPLPRSRVEYQAEHDFLNREIERRRGLKGAETFRSLGHIALAQIFDPVFIGLSMIGGAGLASASKIPSLAKTVNLISGTKKARFVTHGGITGTFNTATDVGGYEQMGGEPTRGELALNFAIGVALGGGAGAYFSKTRGSKISKMEVFEDTPIKTIDLKDINTWDTIDLREVRKQVNKEFGIKHGVLREIDEPKLLQGSIPKLPQGQLQKRKEYYDLIDQRIAGGEMAVLRGTDREAREFFDTMLESAVRSPEGLKGYGQVVSNTNSGNPFKPINIKTDDLIRRNTGASSKEVSLDELELESFKDIKVDESVKAYGEFNTAQGVNQSATEVLEKVSKVGSQIKTEALEKVEKISNLVEENTGLLDFDQPNLIPKTKEIVKEVSELQEQLKSEIVSVEPKKKTKKRNFSGEDDIEADEFDDAFEEIERELGITHKTVKPKTVKPKTVKPKTVKPKTVKPKTVKPKTVKPKTVKPKTVKPKTVKPKTVKPKTVKPKTVKPKTVKPKTVKPKTVKPKTVKPKTVKPKTVKPKTVKPKTVKPKTVKPKTVKPKTVKPKTEKTAKPKTVKPKTEKTAKPKTAQAEYESKINKLRISSSAKRILKANFSGREKPKPVVKPKPVERVREQQPVKPKETGKVYFGLEESERRAILDKMRAGDYEYLDYVKRLENAETRVQKSIWAKKIKQRTIELYKQEAKKLGRI